MPWSWSALALLPLLLGCNAEPVSRIELRQTHYVLAPRAASAAPSGSRRLALEAEWPAPYTVMHTPGSEPEEVVEVNPRARWVPCGPYGRSFRLETACDDGVVRVRSSTVSRGLEPCDRVIYRNRTYGAPLEPCRGRAPNVFGYGAPVQVRVAGHHGRRWNRRVGPPRVVVYPRRSY